jgi:hypothetical protein
MSGRFALLLFCTVVLAGCGAGQVATVSYDSGSDQSTYETRRYTVSTLSGGNYGSRQSIRMRVLAQCEGKNCTPDTAQLVFSADASEKLSLSGVNGRISADETEIRWSNAEANRGFAGRNRNDIIQVLGEFATVDIDVDQLRAMASATSLEGSIGGQSLNLDADVQSGLQTLLRKMRQAQSGGTSSNTGS